MAWKAPALTKATTATRGTNNFVLSDPASQGPYRTDMQANVDGSLPTGSTVHYVAWRTTTTGDAEFEEGWGTYTLATRVVARTAGNVIDGSAGPGTLVDFGLSGQMDVFFLAVLDGSDVPTSQHATFATNLGLPRLAATNVFTLDQRVRRADNTASAITSGSNRTSSVAAAFNFDAHNASASELTYAQARMRIADATAGSEDGLLEIVLRVAGALVETHEFRGDGSLFDVVSGSKYVAFPTGGTVKMLFSSAPPSGWTRVNETNQAIIRLATAADTPNASGGSDSFFDGGWSTAGHTLTESQIPAHTHTVNKSQIGQGGANLFTIFQSGGSTDTTGSTGGGGSHSHNMTTPYYRIACWATYD